MAVQRAVCALGAALRTGNNDKLLLCEPGFGAVLSPQREVLDRVDEPAATGRIDAALEHFYREAVGMTADHVGSLLFLFASQHPDPQRPALRPTNLGHQSSRRSIRSVTPWICCCRW